MVAIFTLLIVITLSVLVTRVASIALIHTGLSKDAAQFQARSAFTGVGFTTTESEQVVNHPVRRKILYMLMFIGSVGIVSVLASLVLSMISVDRSGVLSTEVVILVTGLVILLILIQSKWVEEKLARLIEKFLSKYTRLEIKDYYSLLHLSDNYRISEIQLELNGWMTGKTLGELKLRDEGILVLGIQRKKGNFIGAPRGKTKVYSGDTLILYGRESLLESLGTRKKGDEGDRQHDTAVLEQAEILDAQEDVN